MRKARAPGRAAQGEAFDSGGTCCYLHGGGCLEAAAAGPPGLPEGWSRPQDSALPTGQQREAWSWESSPLLPQQPGVSAQPDG